MTNATPQRRFAVALSFPGEHRTFVEQVAWHLAATFSQERVLYDKYHEEELARLDLNIYLPALYRKDSELIVVCLCPEYAAKLWCRLEWRHISQLIATVDAKRIMFLSFGNPGDLSDLGILGGDGYINVDSLTSQTVAEKICKRLNLNLGITPPAPATSIRADISSINESSQSAQREQELAYLDSLLKNQSAKNVSDRYVAMGNKSEEKFSYNTLCDLMSLDEDGNPLPSTREFADAVEAIREVRRAALLGDPGGGKTTAIWKLILEMIEAARQDDQAPIPLLVELREWTQADQSLRDFIAERLKGLGVYLDTLLSTERAALLLDGLNELPVNQRESKYPQVCELFEQYPKQDYQKLLAVVSCRKDDYPRELGFDCINIRPLDPLRVREFACKYLASKERGDGMFWKLVEPEAKEMNKQFLEEFGTDADRVFWLEKQLPENIQWDWYWEDWIGLRDKPSSMLGLASNPYMLSMLASIYDNSNDLPKNRGKLFFNYVQLRLNRELEGKRILKTEMEPLIDALARIAFEMQSHHTTVNDKYEDTGGALLVLNKDEVISILGDNAEHLLSLASNAGLLNTDDTIRFTHQLLQEYFAAKYMDIEIKAGRLKAVDIWKPDRWWERTNWEEAAILLAGFYKDDCSKVVEWIAEANPEIAAQCDDRSGATLAESTKEKLRAKWIPRLTDLKGDGNPKARAAVGRAIGLRGGDNRKGVGIVERNGVMLPDIDWVKIPSGEFQYGLQSEEKYVSKPQKLTLPTFWISRFPVTYRQFQTFVKDPEGFNDPCWFAGLKASEEERLLGDQAFKFDNHPRERMNWYQAMAFCRWLSWRLDQVSTATGSESQSYDLKNIAEWTVRLPTEFEWEKAARGTDGLLYPYGNDFDEAKGNTRETGIGQTSAVGIFPNGASPYGVEEMSGNVWEWCLSDYSDPKLDAGEENLRTENNRVLRGGAWFNVPMGARVVARGLSHPARRGNCSGFRVVLCRPPSSS